MPSKMILHGRSCQNRLGSSRNLLVKGIWTLAEPKIILLFCAIWKVKRISGECQNMMKVSICKCMNLLANILTKSINKITMKTFLNLSLNFFSLIFKKKYYVIFLCSNFFFNKQNKTKNLEIKSQPFTFETYHLQIILIKTKYII